MTEAAAAQIGEPGRHGADEDVRGADAGPDGVAVSSPEASAARPMAAGRLAELAVHDLALIEKLRITFEPGLNIGVTGGPVLDHDEMEQSQKDSMRASVCQLPVTSISPTPSRARVRPISAPKRWKARRNSPKRCSGSSRASSAKRG